MVRLDPTKQYYTVYIYSLYSNNYQVSVLLVSTTSSVITVVLLEGITVILLLVVTPGKRDETSWNTFFYHKIFAILKKAKSQNFLEKTSQRNPLENRQKVLILYT